MVLEQYVVTPSGPTSPPNFIAVCTALPIVAMMAVILRFNIRRLQETRILIDDWLMIPALLFVIGMAICGLIGETHGLWAYVTPEAVINGDDTDMHRNGTYLEGVLLEAFQYIQIVALSLIKLGALAFYHRIFAVKFHRTKFDYILIATEVVVGLWAIAMLIMNSLQCGSHISALWTGYDVWSEYCATLSPNFEDAFSISNFILDLWILILPLPKIFRLHATRGRRLAIASVFLLAFVGLAASIARMVIYIESGIDSVAPQVDYRLLDTLEVYWSILEAGISLLAVNLPSLWYYFGKVSPERVVASIRSVVSLSSLRSNTSRSRPANTQPPPFVESQSVNSKASNYGILP